MSIDEQVQDEPAPPVASVVGSLEELETLYRAPGTLVATKKVPGIDDGTKIFLGLSPFVLLGTVGADGGADVSPRGGPSGFVRVLDDRHVAIPDLNGNNLIDSIRAVVATGKAGLLCLIPGKDETLRLNGRAWVTTDDAVLDLWHDELRRPTTAIVVRADEVFMHCAKAFRRGRMWDPEFWGELAEAPNLLQVMCAQGLIEQVDDETVAGLEEGYRLGLDWDKPEPTGS
jgi:PPOX class probable FMN-dependent enzyme